MSLRSRTCFRATAVAFWNLAVTIGLLGLLATAGCVAADAPGSGDAGDAAGETGGPCSGVTCSGHGTCSLRDGAPRCECAAGFRPMGTECVETDRDGDGAPASIDCDDNDPKRAPGKTEKCDGVDNNCNERVDEELSRPCGSSKGICQTGTQRCTSGSWGSCSGAIGPNSEKCDMKDNNCDGNTDEGVCNCTPGQTRPCGSKTGVCSAGTQTCSSDGDGWSTCKGKTGPSPETCNGKDDDCDGSTDEGDTCGIWRLNAGSQTWQRYSLDPKNSSYAPKSPIRAAFDIESEDKILVLTKTTYRIFHPSSMLWEPPKSISKTFPKLSGTNIREAASVPASHGNKKSGHDTVYVISIAGGSAKMWSGEYQPSSDTIDWNTTKKEMQPRSGANAPSSFSAETAGWFDLNNSRGWARSSPKQICGSEKDVKATNISVYAGFLAKNTFHVYESGYCFEFVESYSYANAAPAKLAGAPSSFQKIGATTYHDGDLLFFRGD